MNRTNTHSSFSVLLRSCRTPTLAAAAVATLVSAAGAAVTPYDVIGRLSVDDYNRYISHGLGDLSPPYKLFGRQPTIAVNPLDPNKIVIGTTIYNTIPEAPFYQGGGSLWYTADGGANWGL